MPFSLATGSAKHYDDLWRLDIDQGQPNAFARRRDSTEENRYTMKDITSFNDPEQIERLIGHCGRVWCRITPEGTTSAFTVQADGTRYMVTVGSRPVG